VNDPVLEGRYIVNFLVVEAGSKSKKNRFGCSFVILCLMLVMFRTVSPRIDIS